MASTAKSKTTKTKPAKKPATKPAGASVKPKQTKTVKTTKTTTKPANTSSKSAKTKNRTCEVFFGIIMIILAIAIIAGVVVYFTLGPRQNDDVVMVETGKGNQVSTTLTALPDSKASILIPNDFKKMSDKEIEEFKKAEDSEDTNVKVAYTNSDQSVIIYLTESEDDTSNDEIKQGITDLAKIFKDAGIKDIETNVKDINGHNVGTIKFSGMNQATYPYQYVAFFSNNNKATSIAFACNKDASEEWSKVGEAIINSITFAE